MTNYEAYKLFVGDYVTHKEHHEWDGDRPVFLPLRVTAIWIPENWRERSCLIRIASLDPVAWLPATSYDLPPQPCWDKITRRWVTRGEMKTLAASRRKGAKA